MKIVALRPTPWVRFSVSSTSSGTISQSAPRTKRKLRSPLSSTETIAIVVGVSPSCIPDPSTWFSASTRRR